MDTNKPQYEWILLCGGMLVGYLHHEKSDFPWMNCLFEAMPEFNMYRHLFDSEIMALNSKHDDWSDWRERIEALGLEFVAGNSDTPVIQEVTIIHIQGDKAWFRPIFAPDDNENTDDN
jgi:hypothetical protein